MSDNDFQTYDNAYKNLVMSGLGEGSFLKARSFETLVIAERNQSQGINPISKMLKMLTAAKGVLNLALSQLDRLAGSPPIKTHLLAWKNEIGEANSSIELGQICLRISGIARLPLPVKVGTLL
ncbi:hypothetical protein [Spirosoma spitsbergense]|jgi:hypothetical protein|uniref:hypothetical protein n=1 Tax=Spirosoma spitsbergense TaxID=431554 RepID=UPI00036936F3|nr:hypothetical protein [Spirosoma spitsbergense]